MWWASIDMQKIQLSAKDPIPPQPLRKPVWGTMAFSNSKKPKPDPGAPAGAAASPAKPRALERTRTMLTEKGGNGRARPRSAGAGKPSALLRQRPQSAPTLLRAEGFIAQRPYEDPLRQRIEDCEVARSLGVMRREGYAKKELISKVDSLQDPILFDLKVLHNASQRARSASESKMRATTPSGPTDASKRLGGKVPRRQGWQELTSVEKMQELCRTLETDIKKHCFRCRIPHRVVEDPKLQRIMRSLNTATKRMMSLEFELEQEERPKTGGGFGLKLKELFSAAVQTPFASASDEQQMRRLAQFLHQAGGSNSIEGILQALDPEQTGFVNPQDFMHGLEFLGFLGDSKQAFTILDQESSGTMPIKVLEARIMSYLHL